MLLKEFPPSGSIFDDQWRKSQDYDNDKEKDKENDGSHLQDKDKDKDNDKDKDKDKDRKATCKTNHHPGHTLSRILLT